VQEDAPRDPFADDPNDPAAVLGDGADPVGPLSVEEREDVLTDLADLEVFRALLEPLSVRGLAMDCDECDRPHYIDWELLQANLHQLLDEGRPRIHEPALSPDPDEYVTWEYARGYVDGVIDSEEGRTS
jgi:hypothetical protein